MAPADVAADLEGLMDLAARGGVDVRPTLLRTLTDLYIQKPAHSDVEERQYVELAERLIDLVDVNTRVALAEKLASYPKAPVSLIRRLACDVLTVAFPILRLSPLLTAETLDQIAQSCGPGHAAVIATRLVDPAPPERLRTAPPVPSPAPSTSRPAPEAASVPAAALTAVRAAELCRLFFSASAANRRLILSQIDVVPDARHMRLPAVPAPDMLERLEQTVLTGQLDRFAQHLARLLDLPYAVALQIARDSGGEPLVVAAKVLDLPAFLLHRMLLFLDPAISHSVDRVFALADLFEDLTRDTGLAMLSIWRLAQAAPQTAAGQRPLTRDSERSMAAKSATSASDRRRA